MASRDYPEEFVQKALELGAAIGMRPAARQLEFPYATLEKWTKHPDYAARWSELRLQHAPAWRKRMAASLEELVDDYTDLQAEVLVKTKDEFKNLEPRDLGNLLRSLAVAQGITADHVGKLRGQPDVIVERRIDARQLEEAAMALLATVDHEGPVTELPPAPEISEGSE